MPYAYVDATATKRRYPELGEPSDPHFFIELGGRVELTDSEVNNAIDPTKEGK